MRPEIPISLLWNLKTYQTIQLFWGIESLTGQAGRKQCFEMFLSSRWMACESESSTKGGGHCSMLVILKVISQWPPGWNVLSLIVPLLRSARKFPGNWDPWDNWNSATLLWKPLCTDAWSELEYWRRMEKEKGSDYLWKGHHVSSRGLSIP